ncbi:MAG: hypothetical protein M1840_006178 [Geoglossum simile]|nr:MAG: hypothetical protein M1840_006178 [Geoglossum simile]
MSTPFIAFLRPPGESVEKYNPALPPHEQDASVPQRFRDCMEVRVEVFVKGQKVPLENEFDEDDARSFHWVAFASVSTGSHKGGRKNSQTSQLPVATIRLVPPPHPASSSSAGLTATKEPYIKLGRLATLPAYRRLGLARLLINTALEWAKDNTITIQPMLPPMTREAQLIGRGIGEPQRKWKGLVLVHAQLGIEEVYAKRGFVTDKEMGTWDEEGIPHIGMWKKLQVYSI